MWRLAAEAGTFGPGLELGDRAREHIMVKVYLVDTPAQPSFTLAASQP
jgi:hypothetical protein